MFFPFYLFSVTFFVPPVSAQEVIDAMLAVVTQSVITQSDIQTLELLNQFHIPDTTFLYERSGVAPLDFLIETEIMYTLASGVPIYAMSEEEEKYSISLTQKIIRENPDFLYHDRVDHWLRAQLISENYVRTNLGITKSNNVSISTYLRWVQEQKKRVPHRKVK